MVDRCFSVNIANQPGRSKIRRCVAVNTGGHICVNDNVLDHRTAAGLCEQPRISAGDVQLQRHRVAITVEGTLEYVIARFCHSNIIGQFEILAGILPCDRREVLRRADEVRLSRRTLAFQCRRSRHDGGQHGLLRKGGIVLLLRFFLLLLLLFVLLVLLVLLVLILPDILRFAVGRNGICVLRPHRCGKQAGQHDQSQQERYHSFFHFSFSFFIFVLVYARQQKAGGGA